LVTLALAVMVAYGARALLDTRGRTTALLLTTLLIGLLSLDYLVAPIITRAPVIPPFLATLPHTDDGALLEYPFHDTSPYRDAERMLFQTVHGRPISGGYHSRRYPQPQLGLPVLRDLMAGHVGGDIAAEPGGWRSALSTLGFRYIIGYKQQPLGPRNLSPSDAEDFRELVDQGLGVAQPDYEDAFLIAYRVPDAPMTPVIGFRDGWGALEQDAGRSQRWLAQSGQLSLVAPVAGLYKITWTALPAGGPRTLEAQLGERVFHVPLAAVSQRYQLLLDLPAGASQLQLRSIEPATTGDALAHNGDLRPISVRFADMTLEPLMR
jgi:hypothetical protein